MTLTTSADVLLSEALISSMVTDMKAVVAPVSSSSSAEDDALLDFRASDLSWAWCRDSDLTIALAEHVFPVPGGP